jgi:hypothetical protein
MFAASAPSPLYQLYATRWHFSSLVLTIVFAIYAIGLLAALLITGRLSDYLGRRPIILAAIALEIISMICFLEANSTFVLGLARALQGVATGSAIGALSAALVELSPGLAPIVNSAAPTFGLAAGALAASALVQYGPAPMRFIYWIVLAGLVLGAILAMLIRETGNRRAGALASLRPRVGVPPQARSTFVRVAPCLVALWALSGFYLSLAPSLAETLVGSHNLLWGGSIIFLLCASGGIAIILAKGATARMAMLCGCLTLVSGVGLTFLAIAASVAVLLVIGSIVSGVGFGLSFLGAFRTLSALAAPAERAGTIAVIYVVSYLAFSIPIVIAGVATTRFSAHDVALVFAAVIAALAAFGAFGAISSSSDRTDRKAQQLPRTAYLPPCPGTVPAYVPYERSSRPVAVRPSNEP